MGLITEDGYLGYQRSNTAATNYGAFAFMVRSALARVHTSTLVKVMSVTNDGDVSPVGFVDVQPLVNQVDGSGVAVRHGTIFKCPYSRLQGGANALILDPQVGDIGVALFAERDISSVIANKGRANPGSQRSFDMADAIYVGGCLNGTPTQYVQFSDAGITLTSPTAIDLNAPSITLTAPDIAMNASGGITMNTPTFTVNGDQVNNGNVTASGTVQAPTVDVTTQLLVLTKDLGPNHEHTGGTLSGGHTGAVI